MLILSRSLETWAFVWVAEIEKGVKIGFCVLLFNVRSQILNILKLLHTFVKSVQFKRN